MLLMIPCSWSVLIPDWHPAKLNELLGVHWAVAARRKKADRRMLMVYCHNHGVEKATTKRRVDLTITLAPRQRAADPDAYWKTTCDALVACGALVNDSHKWVELAPVRYERGGSKSTLIVLTDL